MQFPNAVRVELARSERGEEQTLRLARRGTPLVASSLVED